MEERRSGRNGAPPEKIDPKKYLCPFCGTRTVKQGQETVFTPIKNENGTYDVTETGELFYRCSKCGEVSRDIEDFL